VTHPQGRIRSLIYRIAVRPSLGETVSQNVKPKLSRILAIAAIAAACLLAIGCVGSAITGRSLFMQFRSAEKTERIVLSGHAASGKIIDCNGGWFNDGKATELIIRSDKNGGNWDRPENITIRNCRIRGSIRIIGLGRNGEARGVNQSSHLLGHTARAQAAAPTGITISGVKFEAVGGIPLYITPGGTRVTVENCEFGGWSSSTGIYLDAESANNTIRNNSFSLQTGREIIAVDGSANNRIEGNRFSRIPYGGVYLYRNCGEGGTVRHQTPRGNSITGNRFDTSGLGLACSAIWLGSRNGDRPYCHADDGYPFGSSADNRDFADGNTVSGNTFSPLSPRAIRNDGKNNQVAAGQ